jgi:sialate O-acetylesterase
MLTQPSLPLRLLGFALFFLALQDLPVAANVRLPGIFGSHMVLQQDTKIPVWGWADAGESVSVTLGGYVGKATAGADGKWRVDLDPMPTGTAPLSLIVTGKNNLKLDDVLVGDVWVCSGQSNMEFMLQGAGNAKVEVPQANDPEIRLFLVPHTLGIQPHDDVAGSWVVCTPETAATFTAVGYFFAQDLRAALKRPIGLIGTYYGGTVAQAWMSLTALQSDPALATFIPVYQKTVASLPGGDAQMETENTAYSVALKKWQEDLAASPGKPAYDAAWKAWNENAPLLQAGGKPLPPHPTAPIPPVVGPHTSPGTPTFLYNGMIAPLIPYAIKGAIWYQGEQNAGSVDSSLQYRILLPKLIADWREKWGEGNFPFLFVQLPNFKDRPRTAGDIASWAFLREAQSNTLSVPNTGMPVTLGLGQAKNIHPPDKLDVGHRLALVARHVAYGENLVDSGPVYDSMKIEANKISVSFTPGESSLIIGTSPFADTTVPPVSTTELKGFAIAGADQHWVWADAKIEGNKVIVSSDQVPNPVAVRYGWADNPECNLANKEGLPAAPFRTDDWLPPKPSPLASTPASKPVPVP